MGQNSVAKDPGYPMRHAQITDLKDTKRIAEEVQDADILVSKNGETVCYMVNPLHYEALLDAALDAGVKATETFLRNYEKRHGSLERLDASYAAAQRGEVASKEDVERVFGRR